ncbi:MAG: response regulator [Rikenellaceae bacterium]|nr:response regulator [Rikenellaceae bacterium]
MLFLAVAFPAICAPGMNYIPDGNIPNRHINAFAQTVDGYMWIGTAKGLCRYNGYEYIHFFHDRDDENSLPSDLITALLVDGSGDLWIATDKGVCRYNPSSGSFDRVGYRDPALRASFEEGFLEFDGRLLVCGNNGVKEIYRQELVMDVIGGTEGFIVQTMIADEYSQLWIGGRNGQGIYHLDKNLGSIVPAATPAGLDIMCSYRTRTGEIWFGSNQGVVALEPWSNRLKRCELNERYAEVVSRLQITFFHETDPDNLLIGTQNDGLFLYNFRTGAFGPADRPDPGNDPSCHYTVCFRDRDGNLWLGTFDKGYTVELDAARKFNGNAALNRFTEGKFVTCLAEDPGGNLWIGTRYHGLIWFDTENGRSVNYDKLNFAPFREAYSHFVQSILVDSSGRLWLGFDKYILMATVDGGAIRSFKVYDMLSDIVTLAEDGQGRIWAGSSTDGIYIFPEGSPPEPFRLPLPGTWNNITRIIALRSGEMLFSAYDDGLYLARPGTFEIRPFPTVAGLERFTERAIFLYENDDSELWIGTYGRGAARYETSSGTFRAFSTDTGLPGNDVIAITEDARGTVWMSTSQGITRYDATNDKIFNYFEYDGTGGNQFHEKAVLRSAYGQIYFGGNHGLTYFDPSEVTGAAKRLEVVLEDLKILNRSVRPGDADGVLGKHISHTSSITLKHRQNVFSIDYCAIDFGTSQKIKYAYRLQGFDEEWNYVNGYRRATYSNLSPGRYLFEVRAQNTDGTWGDGATTLAVRVVAAPWLSTAAVMAYFIIGLALMLLYLRIYTNTRIGRERLAILQKERLYEQELAEMKIRFFTNISHELRTPVSMIYGPIKELVAGNPEEPRRGKLLGLIDRNTGKLLRLLDQLMDFAKIESDTMSLAVSLTDPLAIAQELIQNYSYFALEKNIEVRLVASPSLRPGYIDGDKLGKIVGNLLSNALKYTPSGGNVLIEMAVEESLPEEFGLATVQGSCLYVRVSDTGIGIKEEEMPDLFTRYMRLGRDNVLSKNIPGQGIGLHYVKTLTDVHKGYISAQRRDGGGMVFSFALPCDKGYYSDGEFAAEESNPHADFGAAETVTEHSVGSDTQSVEPELPTILIAEDNCQLREFLRSIFDEAYRVLEAPDGAAALDICRRDRVDLVISDVLMPRMDGYNFCSAVKNDPDLCHIPVVMLTAKTLEDDHIAGYKSGADAYINKPFNPEILRMSVANMFLNIERLKKMMLRAPGPPGDTGTGAGEGPGKMPLNELDMKFFGKLYKLIDDNLSDVNLNINAIAKEMAFSRTSFYRKIKFLTGESPLDFVRVYKLNKAAELLKTGSYSVAEIVDMLGFGTHSHFSLCFKKQFGVSPKDYKKSV